MNPGTKINLLLIEDNPGDVNLIKIQLSESSVRHELLLANNFFDGSDICTNKEVDLVLLDLSLPDSTGFKTLSTFLAKFPKLPVIVLTGVNNEIVGNQAVKAGAQDFLVKGQFDGKLLGRSIRYSLHRYKTQIKLEETAKTLAMSEKRFVEAQEMANFGNWEMDIVSNEMKWTNEVFRIFGFHPNSISPSLSDYISYVHLEDRTKVESFFELATKDGKQHKLEHRLVIEGRNIRHVIIQAKVNFEEINGKILLVGALQDITERKISEQLIVEKNYNQKTSKIKEEVLTDLGFHIRTPLSSIINLTYLLENVQAADQQKEYIDGLKTSVDDLSLMIDNLLNFSFLVADKIEVENQEIKLDSFLGSIDRLLKIKSDNLKVKINYLIEGEVPEKIKSDADKLTQIVINLASYLIQNSKEGAKINIKTTFHSELDSDQSSLNFQFETPSTELTDVEISDLLNSESLLEKYYENPDKELKKALGFAIVMKLIKVLNGTLEIDSKAVSGTTYNWSIPVSKIRKRNAFVGEKPDLPIKILLVEDHFLNQIATKKVLTTWSKYVSVDIAENGLVGVEKFREHGYDIILMDLQMPIMGGIEASSKIREISSVPIIALTAHSSKQESENCQKAGINEYLSKPFRPEDLYEKIMGAIVLIES